MGTSTNIGGGGRYDRPPIRQSYVECTYTPIPYSLQWENININSNIYISLTLEKLGVVILYGITNPNIPPIPYQKKGNGFFFFFAPFVRFTEQNNFQ